MNIRLRDLLERMSIPPSRLNDLNWLGRNLGINNKNHPDFPEAFRLLKEELRKLASDEKRRKFAEGIADYVETHHSYKDMSKRTAVITAIRVLLEDIGAAQGFLQAIGVDLDLYKYDFYKVGDN